MSLTPEQIENNAAAVKAYLERKDIEFRWLFDEPSDWQILIAKKPSWDFESVEYRPRQWTLSRHLPGFPPLREGQQWHREDFTEDMLPEGTRPLLLKEKDEPVDTVFYDGRWHNCGAGSLTEQNHHHCRTRRPLPEAPKPWNSPDDVPGPVCWIQTREGNASIVIHVASQGVAIPSTTESGWRLIYWGELATMKHSTDRREWKECVK